VERVILRFRDLLLTRQLRPGDRLPSEGELASLVGVSRGSIREAMKILCGFGVMTIRAGDGSYVARENRGMLVDPLLFQALLSQPDRQALTELRQLLESGMAALIVAHATGADIEALDAAVAETTRLVAAGCTDAETLTAADVAFHRAFGRAAHNPLVERLYTFAVDILAPTIRDTYVRSRSGEQTRAIHGRIAAAVAARDRQRLRRAIARSIEVWNELR